VAIVTTTPLWVALLAPVTIHEPLTRTVFVGIIFALAGGVIVGVSDSCTWQQTLICPSTFDFLLEEAFIGNMLALVGALMAAGYMIIGRRLRASISLLSYIVVVYGMAALVLLLVTIVFGYSMVGYSNMTYLWFLLLAILPQLIGHSTYNWALAYLPAAFVSVTLLGEPIGSAILAYFFLDETPTGLKIFGAILILMGIYISSRNNVNQNG
jgi:drug/metabolite transporter (DMT)-like permease